MLRQTFTFGVLLATTLTAATGYAQAPETFTATATVKTAGQADASAPVTIVVDRYMPQSEADQPDRRVHRRRAGGPAQGAHRGARDG